MDVIYRYRIKFEISSLSTGTVATSKASVYSVPLDQIVSTSAWVDFSLNISYVLQLTC